MGEKIGSWGAGYNPGMRREHIHFYKESVTFEEEIVSPIQLDRHKPLFCLMLFGVEAVYYL